MLLCVTASVFTLETLVKHLKYPGQEPHSRGGCQPLQISLSTCVPEGCQKDFFFFFPKGLMFKVCDWLGSLSGHICGQGRGLITMTGWEVLVLWSRVTRVPVVPFMGRFWRRYYRKDRVVFASKGRLLAKSVKHRGPRYRLTTVTSSRLTSRSSIFY